MTAEPEAGEAILGNNHAYAYHYGVGDTQLVIAGEAIATEDGTADDGLQKIVGEAHTTKDAEMMEHTAETLEGIPRRDHCRDNHQQDDEVVDGFEPAFQITKVHETQGNDYGGRYHENLMPYL